VVQSEPYYTFTDPLGRRLMLYRDTWRHHILSRHADVADHWLALQQAVVSPEQILFSRHDPQARLYIGTGPGERHKMQVIADMTTGRIRSAYWVRTQRVRGGGVEWPS